MGYSVNPWIDGKEKVYGSIPEGGSQFIKNFSNI